MKWFDTGLKIVLQLILLISIMVTAFNTFDDKRKDRLEQAGIALLMIAGLLMLRRYW